MDPAATVSGREPGVDRITADRASGDGQIGKSRSTDTTVEGVAADGAIGNCQLQASAEAAHVSNNTSVRITTHRSAADCRGHSDKIGGAEINTAVSVVTDITIDDRQPVT